MTDASHRAVLAIRRLQCLAEELRRAYQVTALVQEQRRPFPALEAISATRSDLIMAGATHYWWQGTCRASSVR